MYGNFNCEQVLLLQAKGVDTLPCVHNLLALPGQS